MTARRLRILLTNLHSSSNAGDAALCDVAREQIRSRFPGAEIQVTMDEPETYLGTETIFESTARWFKDPGTGRIHRSGWFRSVAGSVVAALVHRISKVDATWLVPGRHRGLVRAYLEADLIVSSPGGFLYSSRNGLGLMNSLFSLALAQMADKPLYLLGQSLGPFELAWQRPLIRSVLGRARVIVAREACSLEQLRAIGLEHPRCHVVPDLAFLLAGPSATPARAEARAWLAEVGATPGDGQPWIGVTLVDWEHLQPRFQHQEGYERAVADALASVAPRLGAGIVLFPHVHGSQAGADDRIPARRVEARLKAAGVRVHNVTEPRPYVVVKAAYGLLDVLVGTRMHSNIFAMTEGVPVLAIGYQPKTRGIARLAGIEEWVLDIEQVDASVLETRLLSLWSDRSRVRSHLSSIVPELAREAGRAVDLIAEDFSRLSSRRVLE